MKISSESQPDAVINRETALTLMASNMAVPGTGTFLAGRKIVGAVQILLGMAGMAVTIIFGSRMVLWMMSNWSRLHDPYGDPIESLNAIWIAARWPLAGIAAFAFAWIWAFLDSLGILRKATPRP